MDEWIRALLGFIPAPIKDFGMAVENRIAGLWSTVTDFFGNVRTQWASFRHYAATWVDRQLAHALAVGLTFQWLVLTFIPRQITRGVDVLRQYSITLIQNAIATARAELIQVRDWLSGIVNATVARLESLRTWATQHIGELRSDLNRVLDHVFGPLASPDRLVQWIINPLVTALTHWLRDNAVRLGKIMVAQRVQLFHSGLDLIEDIISRII